MRLTKRYIVLLAAAGAMLMLAIDFMGINAGYVFLAAGAAVIIVSITSGMANGILAGLFFNFAFYSMHPQAGLENIALNTLVYAVFAVLSDRIGFKLLHENTREKPAAEERVFSEKITNSFMLAHDMLMEIKKGITRSELLSLLARNLSNLTGSGHILIYGAGKSGETALSLEHSYGIYQDRTIDNSVDYDSLSSVFLSSSSAVSQNPIHGVHAGFMTAVPVRNGKELSGAVVLYKNTDFSNNDLYTAEFFTAQVFIIIEKHDMIKQMSDNYESIIAALGMALDIKDHDTHGHSLSTMKYAVQIAEKMKLPPEEREKIRSAALLHDIGKIKTSSDILKKPSGLTEEEYETIKKHPRDGVNMLNTMNLFNDILPIILYHHEHFDGKGYPERLKGEKIPLGSRICAIADAYSVMLADRPYRRARSKEEAIAELKRCAGTQFDSRIVGVFLDSLENSNAGEGCEIQIPKDSVN
jgi:putative nucleotidyltransferase with HDIG domain